MIDLTKKFTRKNIGPNLYLWAPETFSKIDPTKTGLPFPNKKHYFCNAEKHGNGQDWISNYSYVLTVVNGEQQRLAYVACNYWR